MLCFIDITTFFNCFREIEQQVWKLNASTRLARLSSMAVESQPIVVSQSTEVNIMPTMSPRLLLVDGHSV